MKTNVKIVLCYLVSLWCDVLNIVAGIFFYREPIAPTTNTVAVGLFAVHGVSLLYLMFSMFMERRIRFKYHLAVNRMFMLVPDIILMVQAMSVVNLSPGSASRHMERGFIAAQVFSWISPFVIIAIVYWSKVSFVRVEKSKNYAEAEESKLKIVEE